MNPLLGWIRKEEDLFGKCSKNKKMAKLLLLPLILWMKQISWLTESPFWETQNLFVVDHLFF
jgi:hypothetical protein